MGPCRRFTEVDHFVELFSRSPREVPEAASFVVARKDVKLVLVGGTTAGGDGNSISALSTQVDGGVNITMVDRVALRFGVEYWRLFFAAGNGGGENQVRVLAGVAFHLGR